MAERFNIADLQGIALEAKNLADALANEIEGGGDIEVCDELADGLVDKALFLKDIFEALTAAVNVNRPKGTS